MRSCNRCGLPIAFKRRNGRAIPVNPDGSDHWDACKAQQRAKRSPDVIQGKTIIGERSRELPCRCTVPPWEDCPDCEHLQAWNEEEIARALCEMIGERK
jgi:hypothetical protein